MTPLTRFLTRRPKYPRSIKTFIYRRADFCVFYLYYNRYTGGVMEVMAGHDSVLRKPKSYNANNDNRTS
jgi:hypothetical protein